MIRKLKCVDQVLRVWTDEGELEGREHEREGECGCECECVESKDGGANEAWPFRASLEGLPLLPLKELPAAMLALLVKHRLSRPVPDHRSHCLQTTFNATHSSKRSVQRRSAFNSQLATRELHHTAGRGLAPQQTF